MLSSLLSSSRRKSCEGDGPSRSGVAVVVRSLSDLLVGSNLAWCHPVLFQRVLAAKAARPEMRIVTIDPRRTATAAESALHLPIRADGDTALFLGLLAHLDATGRIDRAFVDGSHHTVYGAWLLARCVVEGLREARLPIARFLVPDLEPFDALHPPGPDAVRIPPSPQRSEVKPEGS